MDEGQFNIFMEGFTNAMHALAGGHGHAHHPAPKISLKILIYKRKPKENVMVWLLQVQNLFRAQGIEENASKIYYAATELEGPSLYWYLNKVQVTGDNAAFDNWNEFMVQLRAAFQPPNYQQHLRQ